MSEKAYRGWRLFSPNCPEATLDRERYQACGTRVVVTENDEERDLDFRLDVRNHSRTGFNWGYGGSGPAQLALAICCDCLGDETGSDPGVYQQFKWTLSPAGAASGKSLSRKSASGTSS